MEDEFWIEIVPQPGGTAREGHVQVVAKLSSFASSDRERGDPGPRNQADLVFEVPSDLMADDTEDTRMGLCAWLAGAALNQGHYQQGADAVVERAVEILWQLVSSPQHQRTLLTRYGDDKVLSAWPWPQEETLRMVADRVQQDRDRRALAALGERNHTAEPTAERKPARRF